MDGESVTERWEEFLAKHRVNQTGVAKRAGISPPMVSAYKSGVSRPTPYTLRRIAEAFGEDYANLRDRLYPSFAEDGGSSPPGSTLDPSYGRGGDVTPTRLACIAAAATVVSGCDVSASAVIALAEEFEQWVVRS